jgi:hypothetical protein
MKDVRFYLEFPDKTTKHKSGKQHTGHVGNVVAVYPETTWIANPVGMPAASMVSSYCAVYFHPDSAVTFSDVAWDYIQEKCKRISEKTAREIHPRLFARMDADLAREEEESCDSSSEPEEEPDEEPDEPGEDDLTTSDHRHFYQYGKLVLEVEEDQECEPALKAYMDKEGFWPDAWFISDHGNAHRISYL